ncbi:CAP domain-containing protein [Flavobacterium buctense]|uniref:CAP domain-containing protein n=1 Tax=Flavobacterium buctense TaxID=1648146 RepID=A0ABU9E1V7_9FLAO|nr:CAP domain-containing protein [Flavobacterium buctense]
MKAKMFRALLPLAIVFTMVSCSSDSEETTVDKQVVTVYNYNETELKLVTLINDYRESQGLNTLQVINHISYKSEEHNYYMIDNNVFNHDYFQQRSDNLIRVLGAERVGENIAYNYQTAESAFAAWLNSPAHKANIEGDYTHFGISVTTNPETGRKYYTNMLIKK